ncbi:MAG: hypothetical protein FJ109_01540 [Deltaproteobacteria bacterium]|nr:hypothetical protein [Deltaproteobacteria bacterium]
MRRSCHGNARPARRGAAAAIVLSVSILLTGACASTRLRGASDAPLSPSDRKARVLDARTLESSPLTALGLLEPILEEGDDAYWSRQAVEQVAAMDGSLARKGVSAAGVLLAHYSMDPRSPLAAHLLFHGAKLMAGTGQDQDERLALYLLLRLIDEHSPSPLWDDAVWLAADICRDRGYRGDETAVLEEALLPHPGWGTDALSGRFVQKVRYRLARLYERQGRREKALFEYALVINFHDGLALKDDALWRIAVVHADLGNDELEQEALRMLLSECPWSRHAAQARERLR